MTETGPESNPTSPAEAIRQALAARAWTQSDLAYVLGASVAAISPILAGKRGISAEMAKALAVALGTPEEHFAQVQARWELQNAREPDPEIATRARIQAAYPLREMLKRGWVSAEGQGVDQQLCQLFGTDTLDAVPNLSHAARKTSPASHTSSAQLAWLYRVRQLAAEMPTPAYGGAKLASALEKMHGMLEHPESTREVPRMLHEAGVRYVVVEGLPTSKIDGACLWLNDHSPVIGMSLRFDRIDNFWFVLRHECAHVLHGHGKQAPIIDSDLSGDRRDVSAEELLADSEAAEFVIAQDKIKSFYLRKNPLFSEKDILAFAKINRVHPGVVVGQLQRMMGRYDFLRRHLVGVRQHVSKSALVDGWGDVVPVGGC